MTLHFHTIWVSSEHVYEIWGTKNIFKDKNMRTNTGSKKPKDSLVCSLPPHFFSLLLFLLIYSLYLSSSSFLLLAHFLAHLIPPRMMAMVLMIPLKTVTTLDPVFNPKVEWKVRGMINVIPSLKREVRKPN